MKNTALGSLNSVNAAVGTAAGTIASGFASFVGLIPDDIGKLVSLIGGMLSIVMINYWRKNSLNVEKNNIKTDLENEILQLQLEEARYKAAQRRRKSDV